MHESQRRTLLRTLFVAACLLPTVATLLYGVATRTGLGRAAIAEQLAAASGMRVEIDRIRYPRPGGAVLEGVRCLDPETGEVVVACREVETLRDREGLGMRAVGAEIFADRAARLFDALERHLRSETQGDAGKISFTTEELTWHVGKESQTLVDFEGLSGQEEKGNVRQLSASFRLPDADPAHPTALRIARYSKASPPETVVELDSGTSPLPCVMFGPLVNAAELLGKQARWSGRLKLRRTRQGWEGATSSDAMDVDFRQLTSSFVGDRLWGTGEVRIHWAEFAAGRIARLRGTVVAGPGQISRDLLRAGIVQLGLGRVDTMIEEGPPVLFDRMEFDFSIDAAGLAIKSRSAEQHDALLWRDDIVYWLAPPFDAQPVAHLLRALAPEREPLVPLTDGTSALLGVLPAAPIAPRAEIETAVKPKLFQPRLRLREPTDGDVQLR